MNHSRTRYQLGSLTIEKRKTGAVWVYRWREVSSNGTTIRRKQMVGTKKEFPTRSAALKTVEGLQLGINEEAVSSSPLTVDQVAAHYKDVELAEANSKTTRTKEVYRHQLDNVISPKRGSHRHL